MPISQQHFGHLPNATTAALFTLSNKKGMQVRITNYGGIVTSILVPDRTGKLGEVNLGFDNLSAYLSEHPFLGAIIGRYGNRIAKGKFTLNGNAYNLAINNPPNHLHGGQVNFAKVLWQTKMVEKDGIPSLVLRYLSKDGEEGYPGNLDCTVTYTLTNQNELKIHYHALTDEPTVVNLTNHCYFNLKDGGKSDCLDHELQIFAESYTPVDDTAIPTGELKSVKRTPFNFLKPKSIGEHIDKPHPQLIIGNGYDHNFVLGKFGQLKKPALKKAAKVVERTTGRILEVLTTEPSLQFYTANWLDGSLIGHQGIAYQKRCAFCLETQHFPDSPNQPDFPSTVLLPGAVYDSTTVYRFSVGK